MSTSWSSTGSTRKLENEKEHSRPSGWRTLPRLDTRLRGCVPRSLVRVGQAAYGGAMATIRLGSIVLESVRAPRAVGLLLGRLARWRGGLHQRCLRGGQDGQDLGSRPLASTTTPHPRGLKPAHQSKCISTSLLTTSWRPSSRRSLGAVPRGGAAGSREIHRAHRSGRDTRSASPLRFPNSDPHRDVMAFPADHTNGGLDTDASESSSVPRVRRASGRMTAPTCSFCGRVPSARCGRVHAGRLHLRRLRVSRRANPGRLRSGR